MKSVKIFNNNAVSTVMPNGQEAILLGRGIGFRLRPGDAIDESRIEKVYRVQSDLQTRFLEMLEDVRPSVMDAAEQIIQLGADAGLVLEGSSGLSLVDHISFAVERAENHVTLPNLMLSEIRMLYQKEYALGAQALSIIERCCGVRLPEDEAGYIALHLVFISTDRNAAYDTLKFVKGTMEIIKTTYGVTLDEKNIDTLRLITHLKFLAQRIFQHTRWEDQGLDKMYLFLLGRNPANRLCLQRIRAYVETNFHYQMNRQEEFYLLVHLTKIL